MKILYLSYDGLTDPLGNSQILPYLKELNSYGHSFQLITYDKKERTSDQKVIKNLRNLCDNYHIHWHSLAYHKKFSLFATAYDLYKGYQYIKKNIKPESIQIIHCRGYVTSVLAVLLKKRTNWKFIFDMRGFWPEEKTDGGAWKKNSIAYKAAKYFEKKFFQYADGIVILTEKGKRYIENNKDLYHVDCPIYVIPTASDTNHFSLDNNNKKERNSYLKQIKKQDRDYRMIYSGSIGTWYKPKEMILFFALLKKNYPNSHFTICTNQIHTKDDLIRTAKKIESEKKIFHVADSIEIKNLSYENLPCEIEKADFTISFIEPCFSKISSYPTKFGETLSCGLPQIINKGIGDTDSLVKEKKIGIVIDNFNETEYKKAIDQIDSLILGNDDINTRCRNTALEELDLKKLSSKYNELYQIITSSAE